MKHPMGRCWVRSIDDGCWLVGKRRWAAVEAAKALSRCRMGGSQSPARPLAQGALDARGRWLTNVAPDERSNCPIRSHLEQGCRNQAKRPVRDDMPAQVAGPESVPTLLLSVAEERPPLTTACRADMPDMPPGAVVNFRLLGADLAPALRAARMAGPAIPSRSIHGMN